MEDQESSERQVLVEALLTDTALYGLVPADPKGELRVFTGQTGVFVHKRINQARDAVCDAMCAMRSNRPMSNGNFDKAEWGEEIEALLKSPTYKRLCRLLLELETLTRSSEPITVPAVHQVKL